MSCIRLLPRAPTPIQPLLRLSLSQASSPVAGSGCWFRITGSSKWGGPLSIQKREKYSNKRKSRNKRFISLTISQISGPQSTYPLQYASRIKNRFLNSLAVQWLGLHAFTAEAAGLSPGQGAKIPQATWRGQKKKKRKKQVLSNPHPLM